MTEQQSKSTEWMMELLASYDESSPAPQRDDDPVPADEDDFWVVVGTKGGGRLLASGHKWWARKVYEDTDVEGGIALAKVEAVRFQ